LADLSISIITPTLNAERYLAECLISVHAQHYVGLEHIVVDGGSADATEQIARANGAEFVLRGGLRQAAAINSGLQLARGEVVAWLNADDEYAAGCLARVVGVFAADAELDVVYGDCEVIGVDGEHLWHERPGAYDFRRLLQRGNYLAQPAVFLRKRVFDRIGYLDDALDYGMDYDLWLRVRDLQISYVPHVLARFRWHSDSKTARHPLGNWREGLAIARRNGGGWTPALAYSFARMLLTVAKTRALSTSSVLSASARSHQ
jgi:glycosyltransferase involved in cell wall biosynthesis